MGEFTENTLLPRATPPHLQILQEWDRSFNVYKKKQNLNIKYKQYVPVYETSCVYRKYN